MWRFENLTPEEKELVVDLYLSDQYSELISVLNERSVAPEKLSPCCGFKTLKGWMDYGIQTGLLPRAKGTT